MTSWHLSQDGVRRRTMRGEARVAYLLPLAVGGLFFVGQDLIQQHTIPPKNTKRAGEYQRELQVNQLATELQRVRALLVESQHLGEALQADVTRLERQHATQKALIEEMQQSKEQSRRFTDNVQAHQQQVAEQLQRTEAQLADALAEKAALARELRELQAIRQTADDALADTQGALTAKTDELASVKQQLITLQQELVTSHEQQLAQAKELQQLRDEKLTLETEVTRLSNTQRGLEQTLTDTQSQLKERTDALAASEHKSAGLEQAIAATQQALAQSQDQLAGLKSERERLVQDLTNMTRMKDVLTQQLGLAQEELVQASSMLTQLQQDVTTLSQAVAQREVELRALTRSTLPTPQ